MNEVKELERRLHNDTLHYLMRIEEEKRNLITADSNYRVCLADLRSQHAKELQALQSTMQGKLDVITRERDLAYVKISELQAERKGEDALTKSVYDLRVSEAMAKVQFLTKAYEEAQRAVMVSNNEIVRLRREVEDRHKPRIEEYEMEIEDLQEQVLRWKDLALKYNHADKRKS